MVEQARNCCIPKEACSIGTMNQFFKIHDSRTLVPNTCTKRIRIWFTGKDQSSDSRYSRSASFRRGIEGAVPGRVTEMLAAAQANLVDSSAEKP